MSASKPDFYSSSHGFEITPPPASYTTSFTLAPNNGFAANVNVQVQTYPGSLKEYDDLSSGQFASLGWTVTAKTLDEKELRYDYNGMMNGNHLRWHCRAIKDQNKVYLITATDLLANWDKNKDVLLHSVNSFKKQ